MRRFSQSYFISANEGNPEGELALTELVTNIIEVATLHANALKVGNPAMEGFGAGWVLSRLTIDMRRYPRVNTTYKISTWVEAWNRHYSMRDFEFTDESGAIVGYARSIWMVLNTVTHENYGLNHLSLAEEDIEGTKVPIALQARHILILPPGQEEMRPHLTANRPTTQYTFKYNDIDFYRHVNTVKYVAILLNQFTLQEFDKCFAQRMELSFMHEGKYGETVDINAYRDDDYSSSFSLSAQGDAANPILFGRLRLQPRGSVETDTNNYQRIDS